MSYKFPIEYKVALNHVHDMITIDVTPEIRYDVKDEDFLVSGYLRFSGTFLTAELGEAPFEGYIPIDMVLPYNGCEDVKLEVAGFDYEVIENEALNLKLDINLRGYTLDKAPEKPKTKIADIPISPLIDVKDDKREEIADAIIEPVADVIDPLLEKTIEIPRMKEKPIRTYAPEVEALFAESPVTPKSSSIITSVSEMNEVGYQASDIRDVPAEEPAEMGHQETSLEGSEAVASVSEQVEDVNKGAMFRQFSDGETVIKMVYVESESETLGGILERYGASERQVWNLSALAEGIEPGDCVMLKYEDVESV